MAAKSPINQNQDNLPLGLEMNGQKQLAVGIAIHQATRSRNLQDGMNGFDLCVDYSRILRLETQIASAVISHTLQGGVYISEFVVPGRFIYFAIDNSDFNEDTPDGIRTLHATATALY